MAAPTDGTSEGLRETSVVGTISIGNMEAYMDISVNDMGTMARGRRIRHAVETCHGNVV